MAIWNECVISNWDSKVNPPYWRRLRRNLEKTSLEKEQNNKLIYTQGHWQYDTKSVITSYVNQINPWSNRATSIIGDNDSSDMNNEISNFISTDLEHIHIIQLDNVCKNGDKVRDQMYKW